MFSSPTPTLLDTLKTRASGHRMKDRTRWWIRLIEMALLISPGRREPEYFHQQSTRFSVYIFHFTYSMDTINAYFTCMKVSQFEFAYLKRFLKWFHLTLMPLGLFPSMFSSFFLLMSKHCSKHHCCCCSLCCHQNTKKTKKTLNDHVFLDSNT